MLDIEQLYLRAKFLPHANDHILHPHQSGLKRCNRKQVFLIGEQLRKKDCRIIAVICKEIRIQSEYYSANYQLDSLDPEREFMKAGEGDLMIINYI